MLKFLTKFHKIYDINFFNIKNTSIYLLSTQNCERNGAWPHHDISALSYSSQEWVSWNWRLYKLGVFVMWWKYKGQSPQCMTSQQLQLGCCHEFCFGHIWCFKSVACPGVHHSNHCKSLCEDLHQSFQLFFWVCQQTHHILLSY